MKSFLIIALIGCVLVCAVHTYIAAKYSLSDLDKHFNDFKQKHGKKYRSSSHHDQR